MKRPRFDTVGVSGSKPLGPTRFFRQKAAKRPPTVSKLSAPQALVIRVRRRGACFQATAQGTGPDLEVVASGPTAARAVSECMAGVAACLEAAP
jgi:hypothetical protein